MKGLKIFSICVCIAGLIVGCGQNPNRLLTDDRGPQTTVGKRPPPTLPGGGSGGDIGSNPDTVQTTANGGTVNFADSTVGISTVWLERHEFVVNGEVKEAVRVATNLAPTEGTLFVLLRLSRWARAEDIAPIKWDDTVVTIRQHDTTSLWYFPDIWPGITDMISIMPLEMLEEQELPRATAELHTIKEGHEFLLYELIEEYRHAVFPPR